MWHKINRIQHNTSTRIKHCISTFPIAAGKESVLKPALSSTNFTRWTALMLLGINPGSLGLRTSFNLPIINRSLQWNYLWFRSLPLPYPSPTPSAVAPTLSRNAFLLLPDMKPWPGRPTSAAQPRMPESDVAGSVTMTWACHSAAHSWILANAWLYA